MKHILWHVFNYSVKHNKNLYISYAYNCAHPAWQYLSKYGITVTAGLPFSRKPEEIERAAITAMFVDGSFPRSETYWSVDGGWINSGTPAGAFHSRGKATNLAACDGHAVTFKDFLKYEDYFAAGPYEITSGGEAGNLYYYFLPMYWYRTDASTRLRN